jgi:23S rRNA pseudouridine1911/1915/1917 synthase
METGSLILIIPSELAGRRIDQALAALCPQHSRSRLQGWIRAGKVTVNGSLPRPRDKVAAGDRVAVDAPQTVVDTRDVAQELPLDIVHEDRTVLVINKPPGLIVHPGAGNPDGTLLNALLHHDRALGKVPRAGIVQRLDKDTSGLMVIARTEAAHTSLVRQLKERSVRREYRALVHGVLTAGGTIDLPIGRHVSDRRRMAVRSGGRSAVTHFRILKRFAAFTWVSVRLETGRTHQIRVHFAYRRHPLVGDPQYGGNRRFPKGASDTLRAAVAAFPRQALHASDLAFVHPKTGAAAAFTAPLPADMQALLDAVAREAA